MRFRFVVNFDFWCFELGLRCCLVVVIAVMGGLGSWFAVLWVGVGCCGLFLGLCCMW